MHFLLAFVFLIIGSVRAQRHLDDPDLFHFVTRPDLRAPRWNITVYDEKRLSPGYWFVAPKQSRQELIATKAAWIGPSIYDGNGQLVWSGATQLDTANDNDFRMSMMGDEQVLSMFDRDRRAGLILDHHYRIHRVLDIAGDTVNAHEFNVINNGKSVLVLTNELRNITQQEKDILNREGECLAEYTRLEEVDIETGEMIFNFTSRGQIGVDESRLWVQEGDVSNRCEGEGEWDFLHGNSADKCDDGHYLFGSRHLSTIYKISKTTGKIIWRLGGFKSDFDLGNVTYSEQHDVRCQWQNKTHTIISLLDNEMAPYALSPARAFSRGLILALNEVDMTVALLASYDHPNQEYAPRRGNLQMLENGNVFVGWSERALHSEHSADGTLLMKASFRAGWMGSYRNYKFEYVGNPLTRPDVSAAVYFRQRNNATTHVYVSWNGDTETRAWNLYRTSADGKSSTLLSTAQRTGFETFLECPTYASYVKVEGIDGNGKLVGESNPIKTQEHPSNPDSPEAQEISPELDFDGQDGDPSEDSAKEQSEPGYDDEGTAKGLSGSHIILLSVGSFLTGGLVGAWLCRSWRRKQRGPEHEYEQLLMEEDLGKESMDTTDLYNDGLLDGNLETKALCDR